MHTLVFKDPDDARSAFRVHFNQDLSGNADLTQEYDGEMLAGFVSVPAKLLVEMGLKLHLYAAGEYEPTAQERGR